MGELSRSVYPPSAVHPLLSLSFHHSLHPFTRTTSHIISQNEGLVAASGLRGPHHRFSHRSSRCRTCANCWWRGRVQTYVSPSADEVRRGWLTERNSENQICDEISNQIRDEVSNEVCLHSTMETHWKILTFLVERSTRPKRELWSTSTPKADN